MSGPPHALIDELLAALTYDRETELWSFDERFAEVAARVRAIRDPGELLELTWDLLRLGYFLDVRRRSTEAANTIMGLVRALAPTLVDNDAGVSRWESARNKLQHDLVAARAAGLQRGSSGVGLRPAKKAQ